MAPVFPSSVWGCQRCRGAQHWGRCGSVGSGTRRRPTFTCSTPGDLLGRLLQGDFGFPRMVPLTTGSGSQHPLAQEWMGWEGLLFPLQG